MKIEPEVIVAGKPTVNLANPIAQSQTAEPWGQLRQSFAMADCDADPVVLEWARRYTQAPTQFEDQIREALPRLKYVQEIAAHYDVAGEFVLLPWVESRFEPLPGRRNRPAGIWQIMPVTASSMGLRINSHYDGRLDMPASVPAVMKLLKTYHDQFHDWRVVDYAYNAGEFKIRKMVQKHGSPADTPLIPQWPVQKVTREHLAQLLAIACVIREPGRFNVRLPTLGAEESLVEVDLPHSLSMAQAAQHAGMSLDTMKALNGAFRGDMIDANASPHLLLPVSQVEQFRAALLGKPASISMGTSSSGTTDPVVRTSTPETVNLPPSHPERKTHRVKRGESLWQIAHHFSVNVSQLQRWNHLGNAPLRPGQILQIEDTD